jgi:hypothetical protein
MPVISLTDSRQSGNPAALGHVIYGGDVFQKRTHAVVAGWKEMPV